MQLLEIIFINHELEDKISSLLFKKDTPIDKVITSIIINYNFTRDYATEIVERLFKKFEYENSYHKFILKEKEVYS